MTSKLLLSMMFSDFVPIIQLSVCLTYPQVPDEAGKSIHIGSYLVSIRLIWLFYCNIICRLYHLNGK